MLICGNHAFCIDSANTKIGFPKGPLYGKNMYIPFLIYYNFPSLSARSGDRFDFEYHFSLYYSQDAHYALNKKSPYLYSQPVRYYEKENVYSDDESCVLEAGLTYNFLKNLQIGTDMRVISYYEGFLDSWIEGFHNAFGFPNGFRNLFSWNRIYVNIPNDNGISLFLDEPAVSFGDIDVWGKWTFFENPHVFIAGLGAFKVPTGRLDALGGSGYPDMGLGVLADIRTSWFLTLYCQGGLVVPFDMKAYPMFNGLLGAEFHPNKLVSFIVQMNIKTSPISGGKVAWRLNDHYFKQYSVPQTNLLAGFIIQHDTFKWQVYFEEDTITNQGTDFTINIMFSQRLNFRRLIQEFKKK